VEPKLLSVVDQSLRVLVLVIVPTLIVPLAGLVISLLQGMLGIREEGLQYSVRTLVMAGVILVFGASAARSLVELMQLALR
jgi:type III secretory pathway component EscS